MDGERGVEIYKEKQKDMFAVGEGGVNTSGGGGGVGGAASCTREGVNVVALVLVVFLEPSSI